MVLQSAKEAQGAASICVNQLKQMLLSDRDGLGLEDDVQDDDNDIEEDELSEEEEAGSRLSSRSDLVEFVPPKTRVSSKETQLFTETFTLKGSSFHEHFQRKKEQIPVRFVLEPINRSDENDVIVQVMFHDTWKCIGYISGIKVPKVTEAISKEEITKITVSNMSNTSTCLQFQLLSILVSYHAVTKKSNGCKTKTPINTMKNCYNVLWFPF